MLVVSAVALVSLIGAIVPGECLPTEIVETTSGPVQGEILNTGPTSVPYAAFKGIRYAKAPVGDLRFKSPVPVDPWTTTLSATTEGHMCPQVSGETKSFLGAEDCLFLNIFTPQTNLGVTPTVLKPVMFWIHGGGFISGSGSMDIMRPDYFLEKNILFISINYRLGALGFLSLDHPSATGNAGLKDQNLALKWVKANIAKFGGDPNSITLIGHGAGSASVGYHILSKSSTGLFQGAISMSGSPLSAWAFKSVSSVVSAAERVGKNLGANTADKEILFNALKQATPEQLVTLDIVFAPTVEHPGTATDPFITESPYRMFYTGNYNKVPQILGFTEQETVGFTASAHSFLEVIELGLGQAEDIGIEPLNSLTAVRDVLKSGGNLDQVDSTTLQSAINITSQLLYASSIDRNQKMVAGSNGGEPVYYYHVSFYTSRSLHNLRETSRLLGAGHEDDLAFIFYIPFAKYTNPVDNGIIRMARKVSTMWANFARYRNPTPADTSSECFLFTDNKAVGRCLRNQWDDNSPVTWPDSGLCGHSFEIGDEFVVNSRRINSNIEIIQSLSWIEEKTLNIPGSIRPTHKNLDTIPSKI